MKIARNEMKEIAIVVPLMIMHSIIFMILGCLLSGCTYSINMVHTEGTATDVVDENQKADADIKPNLTIPAL